MFQLINVRQELIEELYSAFLFPEMYSQHKHSLPLFHSQTSFKEGELEHLVHAVRMPIKKLEIFEFCKFLSFHGPASTLLKLLFPAALLSRFGPAIGDRHQCLDWYGVSQVTSEMR